VFWSRTRAQRITFNCQGFALLKRGCEERKLQEKGCRKNGDFLRPEQVQTELALGENRSTKALDMLVGISS